MNRLLILWLFLLPASGMAQAYFTLVSEMPKVPTTGANYQIQGWVNYDASFYPLTEIDTNILSANPAGTTANLLVPLSTNVAAGTYSLWAAMATQFSPLKIGANVGDTTVTALEFTGNVWTKIGTFTSGISFSNVQIIATKLLASGTQQHYWFAGIGVMPTNYAMAGPTVTRWVDYTPITQSETNSISTGNMLPNSSFEFGLNAGGWTSGRIGNYDLETWMSGIETNGGFHGDKCVPVGDGSKQSRFAIYSPAVWLRGDRTIRQYTLSFYYKRAVPASPSTVTVKWSMVDPGAAGFLTNAVFSKSILTTTNWQRFQTNIFLKPLPSRLFSFEFQQLGTTNGMLVDAFQFEEGPVATAYAPADPIECNMIIGRNGNILNVGEPRTLTVQTYNSTANSSNVTFNYVAFDWMNRQIAAGTNSYTATAGLSTRTLTLSTTNNGLTRVTGWLDGSPSFRSELVFSVLPLPAVPALETNSMFGIHGAPHPSNIASNLIWGMSWQRGLSPGGIVEFHEIQPTEGNFTWTKMDARVNAQTNNAIIFANLSSRDDILPYVYVNGVDGALRLDVWSNFVFTVVNRYKDRIKYWEDINEPSYGWSATNYAPILTVTVDAVKAADSTAYFVALGGTAEGGDAGWANLVWAGLSAETKDKIDAISVHGYPQDGNDTGLNTLADLRTLLGKPLWNTETGVWGWGNYKGDRIGGEAGGVSYSRHWDEHQFRRTVWQNVSLGSRNWIQSLGRGMTKYFYYDGRVSNYTWKTEDTNPTWYNYDDAFNDMGCAYLWSKYFIDLPEIVSNPTNAVADCLAFVFGRSSFSTLAVFSKAFTNWTATVTNSSFALYDLHGNLLQTNVATVPIGRVPTYWLSTTLTSNQLHSTFANATITARTDVTAPEISIDLSPHGLPPFRQLPLRFRWTAVDDTQVNTDETPTSVSTRHRLNGLTDWSEWTAQRNLEFDSIPNTNTFLEVQAKDVDGNTSAIFSGPSFGITSTNLLGHARTRKSPISSARRR